LKKPLPEPGSFGHEHGAFRAAHSAELAQNLIAQQRALQELIEESMSVYAAFLSSSFSVYQGSLSAIVSMLQASSEMPAQAAVDSILAANEVVQQATRTVHQSTEQVARAANDAAQRAAREAARRRTEHPGNDASHSASTNL
jgi:hypothetical protein